jgi:hypothetical protein
MPEDHGKGGVSAPPGRAVKPDRLSRHDILSSEWFTSVESFNSLYQAVSNRKKRTS